MKANAGQDALLGDTVRGIIGVYRNPPLMHWRCAWMRRVKIQVLSRSQPILPMLPGQVERRTHDYRRHGTTSLFAALDITTGSVIGKCWLRHRAIECRKFLNQIDRAVPAELTVPLALHSYASQTKFGVVSTCILATACTSLPRTVRG